MEKKKDFGRDKVYNSFVGWFCVKVLELNYFVINLFIKKLCLFVMFIFIVFFGIFDILKV